VISRMCGLDVFWCNRAAVIEILTTGKIEGISTRVL